MGWKIGWVLSLAVLVITGALGVYNGLSEWGEGRTVMQRSVSVGVLMYGILGLATGYGLFRRQRWSLKTAIAWAVVITYVPGVAVMADGDATLSSAIAASAASAVIALGVVWTTIVMTRHESKERGAPQ